MLPRSYPGYVSSLDNTATVQSTFGDGEVESVGKRAQLSFRAKCAMF